jgi:hypothetical protein
MGIAGTPGAAPVVRNDQRTDQRPSSRTAPPMPAATLAPPTQSYAVPQPNSMARPQTRPQQAPVQAQAQGLPMQQPQPIVRSAPVAPAAAPVHVAPPPQAAPSPANDGGNMVRRNDRQAPGSGGDRPPGR